ncbi:MAG: tetratricopeptide repeat protein [Roseiflexaceae bacterium]|nr:tetratricopeptide repeat protein [Roseiflexaceae bacterium]
MTSTPTLADVLRQLMSDSPYPLTPGLLGKISGLPKSTIINWLDGRFARPRRWEDVIRVADTLRLNEETTNTLLRASGHPPIAELRTQNPSAEQTLFRLWPNTAVVAVEHGSIGMPTPVTPLIDRAHTLQQLYALLKRHEVRLVTLTGVGGTGKTRLAIQATIDMQPAFTDGVYFVPLASLIDPQLVLPTIAHALGLMPTTGMAGLSTLDQIRAALRKRSLLLVLDNFEHLQAASPDITTLLAESPGVTVLVTSRVRLHIDGEHVFEVPPLTIPPLSADMNTLSQNPAVALFVQRARAADPDFAISSSNARVIAEICTKLEGQPLSIELAAARVKLLTPNGVLARLGNRLNLLRWGSHSLLQRHRTLREMLDWSYALLTPAAQLLFRRLAVFMGGCTVDAIETVAGWPGTDTDTLDALMVLTDSSLLQTSTQEEPRYVMLETRREYAAEKLHGSGEGNLLRQRHATYYLQLVGTAEPLLAGPEQLNWLMRLDMEQDNIRAALGDAQTAGRLAAGLRLYWITRGYLEEGRRWLTLALALPEHIPEPVYAKILLVSGRLARQQSDLALAEAHASESLEHYRRLGDQHGIASALGILGVIAYDQGLFERARSIHEESLNLRQTLGDGWVSRPHSQISAKSYAIRVIWQARVCCMRRASATSANLVMPMEPLWH